MVEWLRLFPFLLLCVAVQGSELECDVVNYVNFCWQSETQHSDRGCWHCQIKSPQINTNETLRISGKLKNGTDVNVEHIIFFRSTITKIPNLVQKLTNQQIVDVNFFELGPTKLNSQLFEDYCEPLKAVVYTRNYSPVEGSAFQNCTNLEKLNLGFNQLSSIPFDAFYGLHKLIQLNLEENNLKEINPKWFEHLENLQNFNLNNNYLEEIPNGVFNKLTKLKTLELNDNSLISIRWKMFEQNTFLETISIYGNRIQRIEQNSFRHLSELTMLDLRYNTCINMVFKNETIAEIADALTPCKQSCIIPAIQNGNVRSVEDDSVQTPGDSLENSNSVKVYCNHSFQLFHDKANHTANKCLKDWEDPEWPTCQSELKLIFIKFLENKLSLIFSYRNVSLR